MSVEHLKGLLQKKKTASRRIGKAAPATAARYHLRLELVVFVSHGATIDLISFQKFHGPHQTVSGARKIDNAPQLTKHARFGCNMLVG